MPVAESMQRADSVQSCQPSVYLCHNEALLRPHRSVVDADVVDQAGEEDPRRHDFSATDVQTSVAHVHGNICVFDDENVVYIEPAIRAVYGRLSVSSNGLWHSCGRDQH